MQEFLVVGIENRTSKAGKAYYMLHLSQPFSEPKYGIGSRTSVEYVSSDKMPSGLKVGNTITLLYNRGFDDKAYVFGVQILHSNKEKESDKIPTVEVQK